GLRVVPANVDLRSRTERTHPADLDVEATLVDGLHHAFDGDAEGKRLLELGRAGAPTHGAAQHDRPRVATVIGHVRIDLVADAHRQLAGRGVAELREVEDGLGPC